jgi:hypothetical protein
MRRVAFLPWPQACIARQLNGPSRGRPVLYLLPRSVCLLTTHQHAAAAQRTVVRRASFILGRPGYWPLSINVKNIEPFPLPESAHTVPLINRKRPWTEDEEANLLKWLSEGASIFVIAVRLKRSVMAVQNRTYQMQKREKLPSETVSPL